MSRLAYSERFSRYTKNTDEDARITRDKLVTLRAKVAQQDQSLQVLGGLMVEVQNFMASLLYVVPQKPQSMCKYYGHVIKGAWRGELPHCGDCGALITAPEELRTSVLKR